MLRNDVQDEMKQAMRDKDAVKLSALRMLWSEVRNAEIDAKGELDDAAVEKVVAREVKKSRETIEQMEGAGRDVGEEKTKLEVLQSFQPEMMSKEEVEKMVDEVVAGGASEFGAVMGQVMGKVQGRAEGKMVQEVVKEKLE